MPSEQSPKAFYQKLGNPEEERRLAKKPKRRRSPWRKLLSYSGIMLCLLGVLLVCLHIFGRLQNEQWAIIPISRLFEAILGKEAWASMWLYTGKTWTGLRNYLQVSFAVPLFNLAFLSGIYLIWLGDSD